MKKINLSILTAALLTSNLMADSNTLEDAFKNGKASGEISAYTVSNDNGGTTKDSGYSLGHINLGYETDTLSGFKAAVGFMSSTELDEKENGDYEDGRDVPKALLNIANVGYVNDLFSLTLGRQEIDLEWISDYHEAAVGVITAIPNTTLIVGYTDKVSASANDEALYKFSDIGVNGDGAYVIDATYTINDNLALGAYYMDAKDTFSAVGGKIDFNINGFGAIAKYTTTDEDVAGTVDGNIAAVDLSYANDTFGVNAGYITTDKDGGIGTLEALGENINPLDSGNQVYGVDAQTYYIGANYSVAGFDFGAIYGSTDYKNGTVDETEKEFNFTIDKELYKNFTVSLIFADIDAHVANDDSTYYSAQLVYSF